MTETINWLNPAAVCLMMAGWFALQEFISQQHDFSKWIGVLILLCALLLAFAISARWLTVGHGPFLTMYEVLISSLFSLALIYGLAYILVPTIRIGAPFAVVILLLLFIWTSTTDPGTKPLPPTYETPWLWAHVVAGKLFLGSCLVATSLAILLLLPMCRFHLLLVSRGLVFKRIDIQMWSWLALAFLFHSVMLVTGAVWAQDAWGRYWDWDPLESLAFGTWLVMATGLHTRAAFSVRPRTGSALIVGAFMLAFFTFFGIPFISINPHQGAV